MQIMILTGIINLNKINKIAPRNIAWGVFLCKYNSHILVKNESPDQNVAFVFYSG